MERMIMPKAANARLLFDPRRHQGRVRSFGFIAALLTAVALSGACKGRNDERTSSDSIGSGETSQKPLPVKSSASARGESRSVPKVVTNSIGMKLVLVPAGQF